MVGGDGAHVHLENVPHIEFCTLPGQHIPGISMLPGHFVGQRNALGLGGENVIVLRGFLQQLLGAGHGQLRVAENNETCDGQVLIHRADGKVPLQTGNSHVIIHG